MANTAISYVDVAADTFDSWIAATNNAIKSLRENAVTASNTTVGDYTYGNGFVQGILGANTIVATNIRGGNVQNSSNSTVTFLTNATFSGEKLEVSSYLSYGSGQAVVNSGTLTTNSTTTFVLDSFATSAYRSGKYVISMKDNTANNFQATEILVLQNGGNVFMTEYAVLVSNSTMGTISSNVSSGNVNILYTPTTSNSTVYFYKTLITV